MIVKRFVEKRIVRRLQPTFRKKNSNNTLALSISLSLFPSSCIEVPFPHARILVPISSPNRSHPSPCHRDSCQSERKFNVFLSGSRLIFVVVET